MSNLITFVASTALVTLLGHALRARLSRVVDLPWPMALGGAVVLLGHALHALALAGLFGRVATLVVATGIVLMAVRTSMPPLVLGPVLTLSRRHAIAALGVVLLAPTFLLTLYPPIGYDQTMYHLPMSRAFAATGSLPLLPTLRYPAFPALGEVLAANVLLWTTDTAMQVVGWGTLVVLLVMTTRWAREIATPDSSLLAPACLLGSPIVVYLAATGYVEPLLGVCVVGALWAAMRARDVTERGGRGAVSADALAWVVVAGVFAGSAASVKYLGLLTWPAALGLLWPSSRWRVRLGLAAVFVLTSLAVAAPTYLRLLLLTGSPLYPFYPTVFGVPAWDTTPYLGPTGGARLMQASTFLWDVVFRRAQVGGLPFWSPVFLTAVPLGIVAARHTRHGGRLLTIGLTWLAVSPIHAHYFLAVAPVWAVLVASGVGTIAAGRASRHRGLVVVAVVLALGGPVYALHLAGRYGAPPTQPVARERWLSERLPLYRAVRAMNADAPVSAYGVGAARMVDYVAGTLVGDVAGPVSYEAVLAEATTRRSLAGALRARGITHLLLAAGAEPWSTRAEGDPALTLLYRDAGGVAYRVSQD